MGWTGDSRAVLGRQEASGKCRAVSLTHDHKPNNPAEASRIRAAGGRIERWAAIHPGACYASFDGTCLYVRLQRMFPISGGFCKPHAVFVTSACNHALHRSCLLQLFFTLCWWQEPCMGTAAGTCAVHVRNGGRQRCSACHALLTSKKS